VLYAKVVLGLPVEGPFDYRLPAGMEDKAVIGARAWVNFRNKKEVAYIVGLSDKTEIKKLKELISLIDSAPVLDQPLFLLTKKLAQYYCCSWGEAIEAALPQDLRKGKTAAPGRNIPPKEEGDLLAGESSASKEKLPLFIQGFDRIPVYLREIKQALADKQSAVILGNNTASVERIKEAIASGTGREAFSSFRKQPEESAIWEKIREQDYCLVAGTRSSIFAPVNNLGLIIIDEPQDQVYKQEQVPHYHAREVAGMRAQIQGAKLLLGSHCLSAESFYFLQKGQLRLETIPSPAAYPQVKVIDSRRTPYADRKNKPLFSKFLLDAIQTCLDEKGKVLLVINRKGFATTAACHNCGKALKCPRCNINLVFHFDDNKLKCHHCNFKMPVPKICPECRAGYIKYFGLGAEKVESELARIFPLARMGTDITVATNAVANRPELRFDLIGVLDIDAALNRVDFRAAEKVFSLLSGIINLTEKKVIIQSANPTHHCFSALAGNKPELFFKEELRNRKQLQFFPFKHMIMVKLRGPDQDKVKRASQDLFVKLNKIKTGSLKLLSLNPGLPAKLRGNYYYQILLRCSNVEKAGHFLKLHLKEGHLSGIIVTIDVDPV